MKSRENNQHFESTVHINQYNIGSRVLTRGTESTEINSCTGNQPSHKSSSCTVWLPWVNTSQHTKCLTDLLVWVRRRLSLVIFNRTAGYSIRLSAHTKIVIFSNSCRITTDRPHQKLHFFDVCFSVFLWKLVINKDNCICEKIFQSKHSLLIKKLCNWQFNQKKTRIQRFTTSTW